MARAPILPSNMGDPTGTGPTERRAMREFARRIDLCLDAYLELLDQIEFNTVTTNAIRYEFRTLPSILNQLLETTSNLIDTILGAERARNWFTVGYVLPSYEKGAAQTWRNLGVQSAEYAATRPTLQSLLLSEPYQARIGLISAREFELMKGLSASVKTTMGQQLTAGLVQGIGPKEIAKNLTAQAGIEKRRANMIARTEINQALRTARLNETQDASTRLNIKVKVLHISALSPTTRATHAARSGHLYTVQEERDWYAEDGNAINCYLPGTRVSGRFIAGSKSRYEGPTVELVTADGTHLTVTPNHPVMRADGLIAAAEVRVGDYLLTYRSKIEDPVRPVELNDQTVKPLIEEVFSSLSEVSHSFNTRVDAVDFHGDGAFMDNQVSVVRADRALPHGFVAELGEVLDNLSLEHADAVSTAIAGPQAQGLVRINLTAPGPVSSVGIGSSLSVAHLGGSRVSTCAPIVSGQPCLGKPTHDNGSGDVELFSELLNRYAGQVARVQVVEVRYGQFSGHVYDLEEVSGLMVANGIIASNCKCTTSEAIVDDKGQPVSKGLVGRLQKAAAAWEEKNAR